MNANYTEICRIGYWKADFQQVPRESFLKFSQHCCETAIIQIQQRKVKNIFFEKKIQKNHFTIEIA